MTRLGPSYNSSRKDDESEESEDSEELLYATLFCSNFLTLIFQTLPCYFFDFPNHLLDLLLRLHFPFVSFNIDSLFIQMLVLSVF